MVRGTNRHAAMRGAPKCLCLWSPCLRCLRLLRYRATPPDPRCELCSADSRLDAPALAPEGDCRHCHWSLPGARPRGSNPPAAEARQVTAGVAKLPNALSAPTRCSRAAAPQ